MSERPTVRPVTLSRLVETTFIAGDDPARTADVEERLEVTTRRARETILEAGRIGLITETEDDEGEQRYTATSVGESFVAAIEHEDWTGVDKILRTHSPHYRTFLEVVEKCGPVLPGKTLEKLDERSACTEYDYNETSLDVVGDWAQRLGVIQRDAFTGSFYIVTQNSVPETFPDLLMTVADEMEETAGVDLRQQYLSIPELREEMCKRFRCTRSAVDAALTELAEQNVGRLELSGAPMDTGAKDARYGIKSVSYDDTDGIVTTEQSSEQVMRGVELFGKKYYYLAVYDSDLTFDTQ